MNMELTNSSRPVSWWAPGILCLCLPRAKATWAYHHTWLFHMGLSHPNTDLHDWMWAFYWQGHLPSSQSFEKVFIQWSLTYMSRTTIDIRMWLLENKFWHLRGHKSVLLMRYILCYIAIYVNMIFIYIQQQPQMTSMTWRSGNGHPKYRSHFIFTFTWHTSARYWPQRSILLAVNPINSSLMQNIQCTFSAYKKPWIMSTDYSSERPKTQVHVLFLLRGLTWKWSLPCLQIKYLKHCFDGPGYAWHICRFSQMRGVIRFGGQLR